MAEQDLGTLMESVDARASKKGGGDDGKKDKKKEEQAVNSVTSEEDEKLGVGGKIIMGFVVIIIVAIWLAIFGLVIKMDIGGLGSTILFPVFKDVPYVNKILPGIEDYIPVDEAYNFKTVDEAVERIKELEVEIETLKASQNQSSDYITELEASKTELGEYKSSEAEFEEIKEKFYEEVVFSDKAPDINEYKKYYESIEPDNAEIIYKQVVGKTVVDEKLQDYVNTYSNMKPKNAAAIFDTMTDNFKLVSEILGEMDAATRADILAAMDEKNAAIITQMMQP